MCTVSGLRIGFTEANFGIIYIEHGRIIRMILANENLAQLYAALENVWLNHAGVFWSAFELL